MNLVQLGGHFIGVRGILAVGRCPVLPSETSTQRQGGSWVEGKNVKKNIELLKYT
jgi:hypothetical protein